MPMPFRSTRQVQRRRTERQVFSRLLLATQCGNYDEAERKVCEGERETFDLDSIVDRMARSIKFR